ARRGGAAMKTAEAPFPFTSMFQNGPRRQGSAPQTLFKPGKDFPPPRKNRAPLPAPGRSENLALEKGKGANAKPKPFSVRSLLPPPFGRHRRHPVMLTRPRNPKIRSPPLDDVNNLRHHCKCQRRFASTAIQIRRNALFTSSEYAGWIGVDLEPGPGALPWRDADRRSVSRPRTSVGVGSQTAPQRRGQPESLDDGPSRSAG